MNIIMGFNWSNLIDSSRGGMGNTIITEGTVENLIFDVISIFTYHSKAMFLSPKVLALEVE